jgi:hypothetical protein
MKATAIWLPQLPHVAGKLRLIPQAESLSAKPYTFKREDGLMELGSRLTPASDGKSRQFVSKRCV